MRIHPIDLPERHRREHPIHLGLMRSEGLEQSRVPPHEDARIPQVLATANVLLRRLQIRFFDEPRHPTQRQSLHAAKLLAALNIAIASRGKPRLDARGDQELAGRGRLERRRQRPPKLLVLADKGVRVERGPRRFGRARPHVECRQQQRGRRAAACRLDHDARVRQLG